MANVTLSDTLTWPAISGANYDVLVNEAGGGPAVVQVDTGAANSVAVSALTGIVGGQVYDVHVRSKNPDGSLPSAWSQPAFQITLVGFPVPGPITVA